MVLESARAVAAAAGRRTTRVYRAPRRFDLIGLGWNGRTPVRAQVRARRRGGRVVGVGRAAPVGRPRPGRRAQRSGRPHAPARHGPGLDRSGGRVPAAHRGQRPGTARALRPLDFPPPARSAGGTGSHTPRPRAAKAPPAIIPRAAWGGDGVVPRAAPPLGQVQLAFVHHTATANDYGPEDSAAIVLGIARYHRDHNGWNDLGYNFLVDQYGQIFEGRAGGIDQAIVGAQAQGFNSVSTGVSCIGTFMTVAQTEAAWTRWPA